MASLAKRSLTLPGMQSDWEIDPDELEIAKKRDGSEWRLGTGASAHVSFNMLCCLRLKTATRQHIGFGILCGWGRLVTVTAFALNLSQATLKIITMSRTDVNLLFPHRCTRHSATACKWWR